MPSLTTHQSTTTTKLLLIGDSGQGKTGSLASLVAAGYNLRIIDLDNGLDILKNMLLSSKSPYKIPRETVSERVKYVTLTEPMKNIAGNLVPVKAYMWPETVKMLTHWKTFQQGPDGKSLLDPDGKALVDEDLGPITSWSTNDILVIDSLTMLSTAAYNFHASMNGKLGTTVTQNEHRRFIGGAQALIESLLQLLYDKSIKCNVIVISHVTYVEEISPTGVIPGDGPAGNQVGYPSALGKALSPRIPRYFNNILLCKTQGSGASAKHMLYPTTQGVVGAKCSAPLEVAKSYPIHNGLAEFFEAIRQGEPT